MPNYRAFDPLSVELGTGFDPEIGESKATSKKYFAVDGGEAGSTTEIDYKFDITSDASKITSSINIDARYQAKLLFARIDAAARLENQYKRTNLTLFYILRANLEFEPRNVTVELNDRAREILSGIDTSEALERFVKGTLGTEHVVAVLPGAQISVIYRFDCDTLSTKKSLQASLNANYKKVDASLALDKSIENFEKRVSYSIKVTSNGIDENRRLVDLITVANPKNVGRVQDILADALKDIQGYPTAFRTDVTENFYEVQQAAYRKRRITKSCRLRKKSR